MSKAMSKAMNTSAFGLLLLFCCSFMLITGGIIIGTDTTAEDFQYIETCLEGVIDKDGMFHHENLQGNLVPKWNIDPSGNSCTFSKGTAEVTYKFAKDGTVSERFDISTRNQLVNQCWIMVVIGALGLGVLSYEIVKEAWKKR